MKYCILFLLHCSSSYQLYSMEKKTTDLNTIMRTKDHPDKNSVLPEKIYKFTVENQRIDNCISSTLQASAYLTAVYGLYCLSCYALKIHYQCLNDQ